jgi:hypothetical protein
MTLDIKHGSTAGSFPNRPLGRRNLKPRASNAAVPHIDVGTDVFAFRDDREDVARIQVKTAPGKPYKKVQGYSAKFGVPMAQLRRTDEPTLFYAFAVRLDSSWGRFVVISRAKLQELWNNGCGSENKQSGGSSQTTDFQLDTSFGAFARGIHSGPEARRARGYAPPD